MSAITKRAVTNKGLEVELVFYESDPEDSVGSEMGWACRRVEARIGEQVVGYLKIENVPLESLKIKCPTVWHRWPPTQRQARAGEWVKVYQRAHFRLLGSSDVPVMTEGEALERLKELELMTRGWSAGPSTCFKEFRAYHVNRPKVGYSRTVFPGGPDWGRKGIATLLYIEGAKWVAAEGLPLWGSTLQQESAKALWVSLESTGHVVHRKCPWDKKRLIPTLDYTGE